MSLFASLGHGDIWSISGISFTSPLNDILEKESFTLEELLQEDELLQEVKSHNHRLIEFLSQESTVMKILEYIVTTPPEEDADDIRNFKYPYMSCEILCCEIADILNIFEVGTSTDNNINIDAVDKDSITNMNNRNDALIKLFSILDETAPLNQYQAGYFEKILDMLFRRNTSHMMRFINDGGEELFNKFVNHLENYSILQIVQRLLLPHIPFSINSDQDSPLDELDDVKCNWASSELSCNLLMEKMLDPSIDGDKEISLHIASVMMTVLQISPLDSPFLVNTCSTELIDLLCSRGFYGYDGNMNGSSSSSSNSSSRSNGSSSSSCNRSSNVNESIALASIQVLEVLLSRLSEALHPVTYQGTDINVFGPTVAEVPVVLRNLLSNIDTVIKPHITALKTSLCQYLDSNISSTSHGDQEESTEINRRSKHFICQTKSKFAKLGNYGLQLVKIVEILVRTENINLDSALCDNDVISTCISLMFKYELNSILHLAVQRTVIQILGSGPDRNNIQEHLIIKCNILEKIMEYVKEAQTDRLNNISKNSKLHLAGSRRPILGHLIFIAEFISNILHLVSDVSSTEGSPYYEQKRAQLLAENGENEREKIKFDLDVDHDIGAEVEANVQVTTDNTNTTADASGTKSENDEVNSEGTIRANNEDKTSDDTSNSLPTAISSDSTGDDHVEKGDLDALMDEASSDPTRYGLKTVLDNSDIGAAWKAFISNDLNEYLTTLQNLTPPKGGSHDDDSSSPNELIENVVLSGSLSHLKDFNLDPDVLFTMEGDKDDSDDEEDYKGDEDNSGDGDGITNNYMSMDLNSNADNDDNNNNGTTTEGSVTTSATSTMDAGDIDLFANFEISDLVKNDNRYGSDSDANANANGDDVSDDDSNVDSDTEIANSSDDPFNTFDIGELNIDNNSSSNNSDTDSDDNNNKNDEKTVTTAH